MAVLIRSLALFALSVVLASPAAAQSALGPAQLGTLFCSAIVSGELQALPALLTPDLAALTSGRADLQWHSGSAAPTSCMPVGASGSVENPESVLFLRFADGATASDRLVLAFVDGELLINDVAFAGGGTLREGLSATPVIGLKPEQVGEIFCLSRLGSDDAAISGLLTPALAADIDAAGVANDAWIAANPPDEKPPLGDGIPWQSYPDYAPECSVGLVTLMRTDAKVEI
ncbi:MAG TPA: hypothetical protein VFE52_10835, partial [Devosia sp.]|nr:hypothetical protein [Devosia sp.]